MKNLLLFLLIAFYFADALGQTAKETNTEKNTTCSPQNLKINSSISSEEYKIYSLVLEREKGTLVIKDKTNVGKDDKNFKMLERRGFEPFIQSINPETINDFLKKKRRIKISRKKVLDRH